jgi:hypothetical protein
MNLMLARIDPSALPTLTIAGIFFLTVNLLAASYLVHHWQRLFGRDPRADGDRPATRYLQIIAVTVPLLFLTGRLVWMLIAVWRG